MKLRSGKSIEGSSLCPICKRKNDGDTVQCESTCQLWYHVTCVGLTLEQAEKIPNWFCNGCLNNISNADNSMMQGFMNSQSSTMIMGGDTTLVPPLSKTNSHSSSKNKTSSSKSKASNSSSKRRAALLEEKAELARKKLETVKLEMLLLNEREKIIDEQMKLVDESEASESTSSVSGAARSVKNNMNQNSTIDRIVTDHIKTMTLEDKVNMMKDDLAKSVKYENIERKNRAPVEMIHWHARQSLPKELPRFSGAPEEWSLFYNAFKNSSNLCNLRDDENLLRLQRCLQDPAKSFVKHLLNEPKNVTIIMDTLKMLYGNPQRLLKEQLVNIREQKPVNEKDLSSIVKFSLAVKNLCSVIESCELNEHFTNPMLLDELVGKMTTSLQYQWAQDVGGRPVCNIKEFDNWLTKISANLCYTLPTLDFTNARLVEKPPAFKHESKKRSNMKSEAQLHTVQQESTKNNANCVSCNGNCSELAKCSKFLASDDDQRWNIVKKNGICKQCLKKHFLKPPYICKQAVKCDKLPCVGNKHHPLMHRTLKIDAGSNPPNTEVSCSHHTVRSRAVLRYLPVRIGNGEKEMTVMAFFDQGSTGTFVNVACANALNVVGPKSQLHLKFGGNAHHTEQESMKIELTVSGIQNDAKKFTLKNVHTVNNIGLPEQSMKFEHLAKEFKYLRGLAVTSYDKSTPAILIGLNNWKLALEREFRFDENIDGPIASRCSLGWTIYAGVHEGNQSINYCEEIECLYFINGDDELNEELKRYFSIDSLLINTPNHMITSKEEQRALSIMNRTVKRNDGHYEIGLIWKEDNVKLPDNRKMAMQRLTGLEARFRRDPDLGLKMKAQVNDYLEKGYAKILNANELAERHKRVWYLPVFPAINPNKPEKIRIVFDAKAQVDGTSLNSLLLKGPDQLSSLTGVLLRFRQKKVALTGDIREMFHQVNVAPEDQQVQRFLWRNDENDEALVYMLKVMTFGATCSPSCAQFVKNLNGRQFEKTHPKACDAIVSNHYVDDWLESMDSIDETIQLMQEVRMIHEYAGFEIRNWRSNSVDVLKSIGSNTDGEHKNMNIDNEDQTEKVLGMFWRCNSDHFTYSLKFNKGKHDILDGRRNPTKRETLRVLMSIYDPLGLIAHYTSFLKVLLQEIWRSGLDWDSEIEDQLQVEKWYLWLQALNQIEKLEIPRCFLQAFDNYDNLDIQLHIFVDSSKDCGCAVAYLRLQHKESGSIECTLIASKTRVAPLKLLSIPRLELTAAILGTRLSLTICASLTVKIKKIFYWTDSRTVLSWIRSDTRKIKGQFVAFRISEIQDSTNVNDWKYVPSKLNVSDDATKWNKKLNVNIENRWFSGPAFLHRPDTEWPQDDKLDHQTTEEMMVVTIFPNKKELVNFERFSKWSRLLRTVAYVKRFCNNLIARLYGTLDKIQTADDLSSNELLEAEREIYRIVQSSHYFTELRDLQKNHQTTVSRDSKIYKLSPYVDEFGIIRAKGRIDAATCVPFETKRPVIMPYQNRATRLLVEMYHAKFHHIHHETVINELRQQYLILSCRRLLKTIRNSCVRCAYLNAKPNPPEMAPLPFERMAHYTHPFTYTGVDCMGPIDVHVGRKQEKRWICLFTCLTIRGVHLEILRGMDADSFIMAFRRFTQRRGEPRKVFSDNGTNFVGAERELRESMKNVDMQKVAAAFQSPCLEWRFNPPDSPHMGGSWERLVKSVKTAFYATLPSRTLTDPMLENYMIEIENILNSRPLTYLPLDSEEEAAITPNHFIRGSSGGCKPLAIFDDDVKLVKRNWKMTQLYAQRYWTRWVAEYLPELTRRSKWFTPAIPLKEGDLVLVIDPRYIRNCWLRGRIEKVNTGKDGQVRSAVVRTSTGTLVRPAVRLAKLDVQASGDLANEVDQQVTGGDVVGNRTGGI